jgi:hypothetical protein
MSRMNRTQWTQCTFWMAITGTAVRIGSTSQWGCTSNSRHYKNTWLRSAWMFLKALTNRIAHKLTMLRLCSRDITRHLIMWIRIFLPLPLCNSLPAVVENVLRGPDLHVFVCFFTVKTVMECSGISAVQNTPPSPAVSCRWKDRVADCLSAIYWHKGFGWFKNLNQYKCIFIHFFCECVQSLIYGYNKIK